MLKSLAVYLFVLTVIGCSLAADGKQTIQNRMMNQSQVLEHAQ